MKKMKIAIVFLAALAAFLGNVILAARSDEALVRKIVVFEQGVDDVAKDDLAAKHKGIRIKKLGLINAQAMMISEENARELGKRPGILRVDDDIIVSVFDEEPVRVSVESEVAGAAQSLPWGIERIGADKVWLLGNTGTGIKVGILDTGISEIHPDLIGNIRGGVNTIVSGGGWNDDNGHGSHAAGIVAALDNDQGGVGVGPQIDIYAIKALDSAGNGYLSDTIEGLDWVVANKMQVVNMSLSTTVNVQSFRDAVARTKNAGIVVVAATGNSSNTSTCTAVRFPAAYPEVIAVSATDLNNAVPYWSCRGSQVNLAAPGVSIYSTYKGTAYATASGTSMASPHVAAAAALILKNNAGATPDQVQIRLQNTARDYGAAGFDTLYGWGLVDVYAAVIGVISDITPPVVSITNPAANTVYTTVQTVSINAAASDNVGVGKVEFYDNNNLLATDMVAPYGYDWEINEFSNGNHSLTAKSYDAAGNVAVSAAINVAVNIPSSGQTSWLNGFFYRREISIANSAAPLFDYQIRLIVDTATLIGSGKMNADCSDMRFVSGADLVNYWIESGCNTDATNVWIKMPYAHSGESIVHLYYGNSVAGRGSNGNATFRFFDDFNDGAIDSVKWSWGKYLSSVNHSSVTESDGYLRLQADNYNAKLYAYLSSGQAYAYPMRLLYSVRSQGNNIHGYAGTGPTQDCAYSNCLMTAFESQRNVATYGSPYFAVNGVSVATGLTAPGAWFRNIMDIKSGDSAINIGGLSYSNSAVFGNASDYLKFSVRKWSSLHSAVYDYDYVALANYAAIEPVVVFGSEQSDFGAIDTTAPSVSITAPANNTTYTIAQTVAITASAADNVGVAKVEFYIDGILKATDTTSPYSYDWPITAAGNGARSLTAEAYDVAGNHAVSAAVNVTVDILVSDTTAPSVSIAAPANDATYIAAQTVNIAASASDNVGVSKVEFYVDSILKATNATSPYGYGWPITAADNGARSLTAKAYDAAGNNAVSVAVNVTVNIPAPDIAAPSVSITAPANDAIFTAAQTVAIAASASDNVGVAKVEFYVDGTLKATRPTSPYGYDWSITAADNGARSLTAKAYDAAGNNTVSAAVSVTVNIATADTVNPVAGISAPANGAIVSGILNITATASDNVGVSKVEFFIDGVLKGTDILSPYAYSWNTSTAANGIYSIYAKAYDVAGNAGVSATVNVTVSNTVVADLTVDILTPLADSVVTGTVPVTITKVDKSAYYYLILYIDGKQVSYANSQYTRLTYNWNTAGYANGPHTLKALIGRSGKIPASKEITVMANN